MSTNPLTGTPAGAGGAEGDSCKSVVPAVRPVPRISNLLVREARPGDADDAAFLETLQKMHGHMVGWFPRKQMEGYVNGGHVLIAEEHMQHGGPDEGQEGVHAVEAPGVSASSADVKTPLGYIIAKDQYMKRDDVGIVYQINVLPLKQRNLVGATLVKAAFERAAYGCKLFSCWCAQDIRANWFWEALGFVPLAFRTGSASKQRTHIFWQRRIREGDERTPYWFPSQTTGGAVRQDRIVLPIPPGTHWRDAQPLVLPELPVPEPAEEEKALPTTLPGGAPVRPRPEQPRLTAAQKAAIHRSQSLHLKGVPLGKRAVITASGIRYEDRPDFVPELDTPQAMLPPEKPKKKKAKAPAMRNDPKYIAAARELRDRFLEAMERDPHLLEAPEGVAKYDVSRTLSAAPTFLQHAPRLEAA